MKFGMQNIWMGNEESLSNIFRLNSFLSSPTQDAKAFFGVDDDDEEEDPRFDGIGSHLIQVEKNVGIININGSLTNRYSFWNKYFDVISYDEIRDAAVSLASDTAIEEILLEINTGGGSAHGVNEVSDLLAKIDTQVKPVHAHTSMYTFSAGMWVASAARSISASPMSEAGSIGVILTMASYHQMYKDKGIDLKVIRAGKYKALGNPAEPLTEAAIAEAEQKAGKFYGYFLDQMITNRPALSIGNKDAWAEGKTFFADEAISIGLIDEIESFDKVVAKLSANYDNTNTQSPYSAANTDNATLGTTTMGNKTTNKKTVLNEEALAAAALGANVSAEETTEEEEQEANKSKATESEEENNEAEENSTEETNESEASASNAPASFDLSQFSAKLIELSAELATVKAEKATLQTKATSLEGQLAALTPIACASVNRLEVALGKGTTDLEGLNASVIADKFATLNTTFEQTFSLGGPRSQRSQEDRTEASNVDSTFCQIHKPS